MTVGSPLARPRVLTAGHVNFLLQLFAESERRKQMEQVEFAMLERDPFSANQRKGVAIEQSLKTLGKVCVLLRLILVYGPGTSGLAVGEAAAAYAMTVGSGVPMELFINLTHITKGATYHGR